MLKTKKNGMGKPKCEKWKMLKVAFIRLHFNLSFFVFNPLPLAYSSYVTSRHEVVRPG